jgi:hypothetical protein
MSNTIRKIRLFFAWQDGKEADWLRQMGQCGLRFVNYRFFVYTFSRVTPEDWIYQLDFFYDKQQDHAEYVQLFEDAGWELAVEFSGWHYFRRPYEPGQPTRIYTDKAG